MDVLAPGHMAPFLVINSLEVIYRKLKSMDPRTALPTRDPELIGLGWGPIVSISDRLPRGWKFLKEIGASLSLDHTAPPPHVYIYSPSMSRR